MGNVVQNVSLSANKSQIINSLFVQAVGTPQTLSLATVIDSYTVEMSGGHTFVANDFITIAEADRFFEAEVLSVAVNTLTLDRPVDFVFTTSANVLKVTKALNVDGSLTRQTFIFGSSSAATKTLLITGLRIVITDAASMDDGKFGGIAALTRGVIISIAREGGARQNITNAKNNGDFGLAFNNKVYASKASGGENSVEFTWQSNFENGAVVALEPGDRIEAIVQDNLTGLTSFNIAGFGRYEG